MLFLDTFGVGWGFSVDVDGFVLLGLTAGRTCGAGKWADSFFFSFSCVDGLIGFYVFFDGGARMI